MSTDLEARLRAALADTPDPDLAVDEAAVLARGHRIVRRRRLGAVSTLAVVAAAGLALTQLLPPAHVAVPATTPTPAVATTAPSARSEAILELPPAEPPRTGDPVRLRIVVEPGDAGRVRLTYEALDAAGTSLGTSRSGTDSTRATWGTGSLVEGVVVGYLGAEAVWVTSVAGPAATPETPATPATPATPGTSGNQALVTAPDGTPATVFVERFATAAQAEAVTALLWLTPDGRVHTSDPLPVSQVTVAGSDGDVTVFHAPGLGLLGQADGAGYQAHERTPSDPAARARVWSVKGVPREDGRTLVVQTGQLPPGATGTTVDFVAGGADTRFELVLDPDGGGPFWYAEAVVATPTWTTALASLAWVDAAGDPQTVTYG